LESLAGAGVTDLVVADREVPVATNLGGPRWRGAWSASSATTLVADEAIHLIGKIQPLLIGWNLPDQVESYRSGVIPRWAHPVGGAAARARLPDDAPSTMPGTEPWPTRCVVQRASSARYIPPWPVWRVNSWHP